MNAWFISSPAKPEETDRKGYSTYDDRWQTPFWNRHVVIRCQLPVVRRLENDHVDTCAYLT